MNNPFELIEARLSSIENLILDIKHQPKIIDLAEQSEQLLTVEEAAAFLNLSVATVYSKKSKGELPVCKPFGSKRLYFSKQALIDYIKSGKRLSNSEIETEANAYLSNSKTGNNGKR